VVDLRLLRQRLDPDTAFDFGPTRIAAPVLDVVGLSAILQF
jgi:hypothetical protein